VTADHQPSPSHVDLLELARFLVLPGAKQLLEAFAQIPPGRLRQTAIDHVAAIAEAFVIPPQSLRVDPLLTSGVAKGGEAEVAQLISGPRRGVVQTDDPEVKAVELMLANVPPTVAAQQTGLTVNQVLAAKKAAKGHGLKFPNLRIGRKGGTAAIFVTDMAQLDTGYGAAVMSRAAAERGLDLEAYLGRRRLALDMAMAGRHVRAIMEATKEPKTVLTTWFTTARRAGYEVPYMFDIETPSDDVPVAEKPGVRGKSRVSHDQREVTVYRYPVFTPLDQLRSGKASVEKWSAKRGLTAQQLFDLREKVVEMRLAGESPSIIANTLRMDTHFVRNAAANAARDHGVIFPPARTLRRHEHVTVPERMVEQPTNVITLRRFFGDVGDLHRGAKAAVGKAAQVRGMTVQAYLDLCESIVQHRMAGLRAFEIADLTGEKQFMVKDIIAKAVERGAVFPPYNAMAYAEVRKAAARG
jgi:hypothetical protein